MRKWALVLLLACASLWTQASASGPLPDNIAMLMKCTACERVVEYLNQHFISGVRRWRPHLDTRLPPTPPPRTHTAPQWIQKDVKWSKKMKGTFKRVVAENSCANPVRGQNLHRWPATWTVSHRQPYLPAPAGGVPREQ